MKPFLLLVIIVIVGLQPDAVLADAQLPGSWGLNGEVLYQFNADGTGEMNGASFQWQASAGVLTLTADGLTDEVGYQIQGEQLILVMGGVPLPLQRIGKGGEVTPPNTGTAEAGVKTTVPTAAPTSDSLSKSSDTGRRDNQWLRGHPAAHTRPE